MSSQQDCPWRLVVHACMVFAWPELHTVVVPGSKDLQLHILDYMGIMGIIWGQFFYTHIQQHRVAQLTPWNPCGSHHGDTLSGLQWP